MAIILEDAMVDRLQGVIDGLEASFNAGELRFGGYQIDLLPESTRAYLRCFVLEAGVGVELCESVVDGTYLFRLDDPVVGFLHHDSVSGVHMWINRDFSDNLNPKAVFWYLMCLKVGLGNMV
jgi:hypothetical protein